MKKKFAILDGNNLLFRAYYALPLLANFDGEYSNGVFGFTNMLIHIIQDIKPDYIAVCFDKGKTFRHEMYGEYKAQRSPAPQELLNQFPIMERMLDAMNIKHLGGMGLEADDIIGCLSRMYDTENIIVTADKDCLQLINDHTKVLVPHKGVSESELVGEVELKEKYGIAPYQIIELKSLMGDPSDNIPGVKGVGEKTALKLLQDYVTLEGVYSHIDEISGKLHEKLMESENVAKLSHTLATIVTDKALPFELSDFEYSYPFSADVLQLFKQYQFNSLLKKSELFDENSEFSDNKLQDNIKTISIDDLSTWNKTIDKLVQSNALSLHIGDDALSVYNGETAYMLPIKKDLISPGFELDKLLLGSKKLFESKVSKIVYDSKSLKHTLREFDINLNNVSFDILLGRYILNSVGKVNVSFAEVITENRCTSDVDAYNLYSIYLSYKSKLEEYKLNDIYYDMELPLTSVLFDMEIQGFKLDKDELQKQSDEYNKNIKQITNDIYELAGCEFNLNSPKQLGEVLFDKLAIKSYNNKKKSTNAQVLEDIIDKHPIVPLIIRYRLLSKLYNTYIVPYKEMINEKTGKIYTVFNQFVTATGRLSSSEPNLQNIP
ncbi:MAG: DNA polymerase I, partial [Clostridia bacterium]|nr:DNA polymerase I [Clostridia bacterium]